MKNSIVLIIALGGLWATSCTKGTEAVSPKQQNNSSVPAQIPQIHTHLHAKDGGEDTDPIIIIEDLVDNNNSPLANADVVAYNQTDTIAGTTDFTGHCNVHLPTLSTWHFSVTHQGFVPIKVILDLQDTVTRRNDTMQLQ
jgi:hypothetical protein